MAHIMTCLNIQYHSVYQDTFLLWTHITFFTFKNLHYILLLKNDIINYDYMINMYICIEIHSRDHEKKKWSIQVSQGLNICCQWYKTLSVIESGIYCVKCQSRSGQSCK